MAVKMKRVYVTVSANPALYNPTFSMLPEWEMFAFMMYSAREAAMAASIMERLSFIRGVTFFRTLVLKRDSLYGYWDIVCLRFNNIITKRLRSNEITMPLNFQK